MPTTRVAGIDGYRGGWVVADVAVEANAPSEISSAANFDEVLAIAEQREWKVIGVDMPIGLPAAGRRASDREARRILGPRASSLFPTPTAEAVEATSHERASAVNRELAGVGVSIQAFNLFPRIREVRRSLADWTGCPVHEVHPETSFCLLGGQPLGPKSDAAGRAERTEVLRRVFPDIDQLVERRGRLPEVDVLDALAAAWTARRIAAGRALVLGDPTDRDDSGHELTMRV